MFDKILIANRGEIACRIIRSCRKLGIATVAVCSEADKSALHVRMADEQVLLGPAPAAESYLRIDRIIEACKVTGAQAVHPGYGFLSERAAFARALEAEGIVFIGPPVRAIEAMGDKIESKRLAAKAGVSTVPGTADAIDDIALARKVAAEIGYPVMIKASAGGGGKGMRIAMDESELEEGIERARSEAGASFGDDRVFIEKFIVQPRHIEIQVLGDKHGNCIWLGERECSIQRRHQKVIEEAPSPFLDEATRRAMGEQAVALARAVDYCSAGTVEFIVDGDRNFYFLEMNTRLQVEHPVTELVTGIDLVEAMIEIAAGQPLRLRQEDVKTTGWAIEARVYAEDPAKGFLPSTGRLVGYAEPREKGVRVDSGVREGGEVSMFYDPMIAKLCAHGPTREAATALLEDALDNFLIRGPGHNLGFLSAVLAHPRFRKGDLSTGFIAEEYGERFAGVSLDEAQLRDMAAVAAAMRLREQDRERQISGRMTAAPHAPDTAFVVQIGEKHDLRRFLAVEIGEQDGSNVVSVEGAPPRELVLHWRPGLRFVRATIDGRLVTMQAVRRPEGFEMTWRGATERVRVRHRRAQQLAELMPEKPEPDTSGMLIAPMPGIIVRASVTAGEEVKAGQELCVLEAMKMENVLRAERDATVAEVCVADGDIVAAEAVLMRFA